MIVHLLPFKHDQYELVFPLLSIKSGCQSSDKERSRKLDNFLLVYMCSMNASNVYVKSIKINQYLIKLESTVRQMSTNLLELYWRVIFFNITPCINTLYSRK